MILIQDTLKDICAYIKRDLKLDYDIKFEYCTINELAEKLTKKGSDNSRYPLFFANSIGTTYVDNVCTVSDIIIATKNVATMYAERRNEVSIKPILMPIYEEFIKQLWVNREFSLNAYGNVTPHYFYGEEGKTGYESLKFPDFVDVISIKNMKFTIRNKSKK